MATRETKQFVAPRRFGWDAASMTRAHWLAAVLAAITGIIHVYLYVNEGFVGFLVASLVFFGAIIAMALNVYRRVLYVLGVPFTAGQIAFWFLAGMPTFELGVVDKLVQVALIVALIYLFRLES